MHMERDDLCVLHFPEILHLSFYFCVFVFFVLTYYFQRNKYYLYLALTFIDNCVREYLHVYYTVGCCAFEVLHMKEEITCFC